MALNAEDAKRLRVEAGEQITIKLDGAAYSLPAKIKAELPLGIAGLPVGLPGLAGISLPSQECLGTGAQAATYLMTSPYPIATIIGVLIVALSIASGLIWLERRLLALWQDRYGPNRVGPFGLLQVVADMIKIFTKEDWIPPFADKPVFVLAPAIIVVTVLMTFAVLPIAPGIIVTDLNIGLLFFLAMSSLGVYSVVLAGWSSDNKYSLLGGLRAAAQMISYEVFMGLSLMGVVVLAGSFDLGQDC